LKARVLSAARRDPSPTRRSVTFDAVLVLLIAAAGVLNVFLALGGMVVGCRPGAVVWSTTSGSAFVAVLASWAAFARGGSMLGRSRRWLTVVTVTTPLVTLGWLAPGFVRAAAGDPASTLRCFLATAVLGVLPLSAMSIAHR
jgi:hypothetical protein